jgi:hypothetical protein
MSEKTKLEKMRLAMRSVIVGSATATVYFCIAATVRFNYPSHIHFRVTIV